MIPFFFISLLFFYGAPFSSQVLTNDIVFEESERAKDSVERDNKSVVKLKRLDQKTQPVESKNWRLDPMKMGLLGVFEKKENRQALDEAHRGAREPAELAAAATGISRQETDYMESGTGIQFIKSHIEGEELIIVSDDIKTEGRSREEDAEGNEVEDTHLSNRAKFELVDDDKKKQKDEGVGKTINENAVLQIIYKNKIALEPCYDFALYRNPGFEGTVLLEWEIVDETARNIQVVRDTTGDDMVFARCLMTRLQDLQFTDIGLGMEEGQVEPIRIPFSVK